MKIKLHTHLFIMHMISAKQPENAYIQIPNIEGRKEEENRKWDKRERRENVERTLHKESTKFPASRNPEMNVMKITTMTHWQQAN